MKFSSALFKSFFASFALLFSLSTYCQTITDEIYRGLYEKVYRLDSAQARFLYVNQSMPDSVDFFTNLDSTYRYDSTFRITGMPSGHYLIAKAINDRVEYSVHENEYFNIKMKGYNREAWIFITDKSGRLLKDATITIGEEEFAFRDDCGCHPIPGIKGNGFAKISHGKEFTFVLIDGYKPPKPVYRNQKSKYHNSNKLFSDVRILPGYVATNQPKYHLADTVKMKAFLVNEKGKPWKRKVKIKILDPRSTSKKKTNYGAEVFATKAFKPLTEGAFVYNFPIPDTFKINQDYNLSFQTKKGQILKRSAFRVEDYELKKTTFKSELTQNSYHKGEKVQIKLSATDANGLPLLDASAEVIVRLKSMPNHHLDSLYYPLKWNNEFFKTEVLLDVSGETYVEIPDSLFPWMDASFAVNLTMKNSSNEHRKFYHSFTYNANTEKFDLKVEGDTLYANFNYLGKPSEGCQVTLKSFGQGKLIKESLVTLPYTEKVDYAATGYSLYDESGMLLKSITPPSRIYELIYIEGKRTHDSVQFKLVNEVGIPVSYQLFKGKKKIDGGRGKNMSFEALDESLDSYYVIYSFRWGANEYIHEKGLHIKEKELTVQVDQPEKVFPGARVPITVIVKDYKTNPADKVNLTAWSVNAQFGNIPHPNMPYFGLKHFNIISSFNVQFSKPHFSTQQPVTHTNIERLELYKTPYYRFIYSVGGVDTEYDSIPGTMAEFSPYVYKDQNLEAIHTVYFDNEPVYIGNGDRIPMSFRYKPGTYKVGLRTDNHMYEIDEVVLKKQMKSFTCLNVDSAFNNKSVKYVKLDTVPYMEAEEKRLAPYMLIMNCFNANIYFEQDSNVMHYRNTDATVYDQDFDEEYYGVGPFKKGNINVIDTRNDTAYSFYFEPGYYYHFGKDTSWVSQPLLTPNSLKRVSLYNYRPSWNFNELAMRPPLVGKARKELEEKQKALVVKEQVKTIVERRHPMLKTRYQKGKYRNDKCNFTLKNGSKIKPIWTALFNLENDSASMVMFSNHATFSHPKAGKYDIVVFRKDSSMMVLKAHNLYDNGQNFLTYDESYFKPYDEVATKLWEEKIIELNKPPVKKFRNKPTRIDGVTITRKPTLDRSTQISGYFLDNYGNPMNNVHIYAEIAGIYKAGAETNAAGYFEMKDVQAGNYMFKMIMPNRLSYSIYNLKVTKGQDNHVMIEPEIVFGYAAENYAETSVMEDAYNSASYGASGASYSSADMVMSEVMRKEGRGRTISREEITKLPARSSADIASTIGAIPGVVATGKLKEHEKDALEALKNDPNSNRIRKNFRDYGFWVPNAVTNKDGIARFEVIFPDNITKWKTIVPAMDGKKQTGIGFAETKSYKPLSASLGIPNFLVAGDTVQLIGKLLNYMGEPIPVKTYFNLNGKSLYKGERNPETFEIENYAFSQANAGEAKLTYGLDKGDGYVDGEERKLKVKVNGVEQTTGTLFDLMSDTSFTIPSSDNLLSRTLYITNDPLDLVRKELEDLKNYNYGCNEQTASKLKALLLEKKFMISMNEHFRDEKTLVKCIKTLEQNQNKNGSWGWWGPSGKDNVWITGYVTEALNMAVASGFRTRSHMRGAEYLHKQLNSLNHSEQLEVLDVLSSIPFPMDYKSYFSKYDEANLSLQDRFKYLKLRQKRDSVIDINEVTSSFTKGNKGIFWGEEFMDIKVNKLQTSLLAYEILKKHGGNEELMKKTRSYFMNYKVKEKNTIEQASLIQTFLHDMIKASDKTKAIEGTLKINGVRASAEYPKELKYQSNESIKIEKSGAPIKIYSYEHRLESNPVSSDTLFKVSTKFLEDGKEVTTLTTSKPVRMEVDVIVKKGCEYVLIEVPIPAGCSYGGNIPTKHRMETHRESYKHMTAIACSKLGSGRNKFYIDLVPRFEGSFTVLPANAQLMYFPSVSNYTGSKKIKIVSE